MSVRRKRLTFEDRQEIEALIKKKVTIAVIAKEIGCHRDTIYKELHRHMKPDDYAAGDYTKYSAEIAQMGGIREKSVQDHKEKADEQLQLKVL